MGKFFKTLGKGILYILGLPILVIFLAVYLVISIFGFIATGIYSLVMFFKGESINGKLPEDVEAEKRLDMWLNPIDHINNKIDEMRHEQIELKKELEEQKRKDALPQIEAKPLETTYVEVPMASDNEPKREEIFAPIDEPKNIEEESVFDEMLDEKEDN